MRQFIRVHRYVKIINAKVEKYEDEHQEELTKKIEEGKISQGWAKASEILKDYNEKYKLKATLIQNISEDAVNRKYLKAETRNNIVYLRLDTDGRTIIEKPFGFTEGLLGYLGKSIPVYVSILALLISIVALIIAL
jgi:hypothetical protein